MSPAEFWARLTGIYPDELRRVLDGRTLGEVFPVESMGGTLIDWHECPLCGESDESKPCGPGHVEEIAKHEDGCPHGFK